MVTVSLCMIVKNEEAVLARCLDSVMDLVDEIVIVDTGSEDKTKEIAKRYTDRIYDYPWDDHFSNARNYAFSKGTGEYLMWLDADDVVSEENRKRFLQMKRTLDKETDMVMLPYETAFDENGNPVFSYYRERLVKNGRGFCWEGAVHEAIVPRGKVVCGEAAIWHCKIKPGDSGRNLRIYEGLLAAGEQLDARHAFYYARELLDHGLYERAEQAFHEYLERLDGWVENQIEACRQLAACRKVRGDDEGALGALFKSFQFDVPRAEILCDIGAWFIEKHQYEKAVYWYRLAPEAPRRDKNGGFVQEDCYGYIPYLQLCVCYDRMGYWEEAEACNDKAGVIKPQSEPVRQNRKYFEARRRTSCGKE